MNNYVVGNGDFAILLKKYLYTTLNISVDGFTVSGDVIKSGRIEDVPVIPTEEMLKICDPDNCTLYMGIGYRNMNQIKEKTYLEYKNLGYSFSNYIHPSAIIGHEVKIGEANNIFDGVIIQGGASIGNANLIYGGALVGHDTVIGNYNSMTVRSCLAGYVKVGNNCFIGANSTVRDHLTIADFTLIGAGTYVDADTKPNDVVVHSKSYVLEGRSSLEFI